MNSRDRCEAKRSEPLSSRGGTGRENVSVAAAAAPFDHAAEAIEAARQEEAFLRGEVANTDHPPYLRVRFAKIASTISALLPSAEGPTAFQKIVAAHSAAADAAGEKAGITQAERAQRTSEHPSTGMREALEKLVFAARTSGGTAGRDEQLCSACDAAETALEIDRQIERAKREGNMAIGAVGGAALSSTGDELLNLKPHASLGEHGAFGLEWEPMQGLYFVVEVKTDGSVVWIVRHNSKMVHGDEHKLILASTGDERREAIEAALWELVHAAEKDLHANQTDDPGGWWSLRTENAIKAARSLLHAAPDGGGE